MWFLFVLLSAGLWAIVNILDSVIVHHYEPHALVQSFYRGLLRFPMLLAIPLFLNVETEWTAWLLLSGLSYYLLIITYLYALKYIDTSVTQSAWALQAIFLSAVGFLWFHETWSAMQTVGSILVLLAIFCLCYWHKHLPVLRTIGLLLIPALAGMPGDIILKVAADNGVSPLVSAYWSFLGAAVIATIIPMVIPSYRAAVLRSPAARQWSFYVVTFLVVLTGYSGFAALIAAYAAGPLSLVSVASNVQPFLVILFAWLLLKTNTTHVPKELLTKQSVQVKLTCFTLVFVGLAFLLVDGQY